ncbi:hypothetical protein OIDMADRAFT_19097 [Oidiodendron maius Zn]|uniref:Uncharacterized protein n=1 Tax=Oidiodendron maius (strain Zn) TaxID=913774 RepID=A0A0C3GY79_OIDMZ|nr:hypothetical protein OIDMADRAFT_19097 [Oidiodendron maius Zn]
MQFSVVAILPLLALAFAAPAPQTESLVVRATTPPAEASVMTDANGNIIAFDSAGVYLAAKANGQ